MRCAALVTRFQFSEKNSHFQPCFGQNSSSLDPNFSKFSFPRPPFLKENPLPRPYILKPAWHTPTKNKSWVPPPPRDAWIQILAYIFPHPKNGIFFWHSFNFSLCGKSSGKSCAKGPPGNGPSGLPLLWPVLQFVLSDPFSKLCSRLGPTEWTPFR